MNAYSVLSGSIFKAMEKAEDAERSLKRRS